MNEMTIEQIRPVTVLTIHDPESRSSYEGIAEGLHPNPFISSGTFQIKRTHDKITRFTPNFVICGIVTTGSDGCYAPKDMKCWFGSWLEWKCNVQGPVTARWGMVDITGMIIIALILVQTALFVLLMKGLNLRIMTIAQLVDDRIGNALENLEAVAAVDDPLGRIKGIIQMFQDLNTKPIISAEVTELKRGDNGLFEKNVD